MIKNILIIFFGFLIGCSVCYWVIFYTPLFSLRQSQKNSLINPLAPVKKQVIGFLPYWLVDKATSEDYNSITMLSYFGLTIDNDGTILKLANPTEQEPGWTALQSGKLDTVFSNAKKNNLQLSLLVFSGTPDSIGMLIDDPISHAKNLADAVIPLMKHYGFTDLNVDIEDIHEASAEARTHFTQFAKTIKERLNTEHAGTLTVDISPTDLIKNDLIDPLAIGQIADNVVIMTYDYHFIGSFVTGPVAPISGAGTVAEFDTNVAIQKALEIMPVQKIILGVPLYGYEWETIDILPRSAVIPQTGLIASNLRVEELLSSCATCSANFDTDAKEPYVIYKDDFTGTYHQLFFPNEKAVSEKIDFANSKKLGGVALWALGDANTDLLLPLKIYKSQFVIGY